MLDRSTVVVLAANGDAIARDECVSVHQVAQGGAVVSILALELGSTPSLFSPCLCDFDLQPSFRSACSAHSLTLLSRLLTTTITTITTTTTTTL